MPPSDHARRLRRARSIVAAALVIQSIDWLAAACSLIGEACRLLAASRQDIACAHQWRALALTSQ